MLSTDVCIIGGGPGGLACADLLANHGVELVIVNEGSMMGYGIDGAFASKAEFEITRQYVYASRRPEIYGDLVPPSFERMVNGVKLASAGLRESLTERMNRFPSVQVISGRGVFLDPGTLQVGEEQIKAKTFVIGTGSRPRIPGDVDTSSGRILTSDTIFDMESLPDSMLIVGAGIIGCEFACIFSALGCEVTLLDSQPHILGTEDPDVSVFMADAFEAQGVRVVSNGRFERVEVSDTQAKTHLNDGRTINSDVVLFAIGRESSAPQLNLTAAGVKTDERGYIPTSGLMRTNVQHIYAVGDVGQRNTPVDMALVHVAQAEGRCAAHQIMGETFNSKMDHVPYIVFTIPMLAGAGLSETAARAKYGDNIRVGKYAHSRNHRAHANLPAIGFTKLIVGPPGDDRIIGIRVIGKEADSLVAASSIMIEQQLPFTYLLDCIFPHPSLVECLQGAAHIIEGDTTAYATGEEHGLS